MIFSKGAYGALALVAGVMFGFPEPSVAQSDGGLSLAIQAMNDRYNDAVRQKCPGSGKDASPLVVESCRYFAVTAISCPQLATTSATFLLLFRDGETTPRELWDKIQNETGDGITLKLSAVSFASEAAYSETPIQLLNYIYMGCMAQIR
jgi:hypothetical protein